MQFFYLSFFAQIIGGLGAGTNSTAAMALVISTTKKSEREKNLGMIEMFTGVGFLVGPLWGSVMFNVGGYSAPFASVALIYFLCYPFIMVQLWKEKKARLLRDSSDKKSDRSRDVTSYGSVGFFKLIRYPRFVFGLGSQTIMAGAV